MVLSNEDKKAYMKRLLMSRMRILINNGFYGLLIMHLVFALDEKCEKAATDGVRLYLNPTFLNRISDDELDYVLMHEVLHIALRHCSRAGDRDSDQFGDACDIVVNSNILKSCGMDRNSITLEGEECPHLTPNGDEGYEYTAEQIYEMIMVAVPDGKGSGQGSGKSGGDKDSGQGTDGSGENDGSGGETDNEGDEDGSDKKNKGNDARKSKGKGKGGKATGKSEGKATNGWDDHSRWEGIEDDEYLQDLWVKRFEDACEAMTIRDPSHSRGLMPEFAVRMFKELRKPQIDWRTILDCFVQEEIADYSFMPPDRRMDECDFFLPDFNEKDYIVRDILFMIDTSASMSDDMITAAYAEIKGAIDQFNGKLEGWLGFFDAGVTEPKPFTDENEFRIIKPMGGGGTSFHVIFQYVKKYMEDQFPASIIILTDGYAPFPEESMAMGIPVLWLLNNEEVEPPWGKVARITI